MLCVDALVSAGVTPDSGDILVTGASGWVGSTAVVLTQSPWLPGDGRIGPGIDAITFASWAPIRSCRATCTSRRPVAGKLLWAGAVDTVGGPVLAKVLAQTQYRGCVAACGLAGGFDLPTTVMPFILRNVRLQGWIR